MEIKDEPAKESYPGENELNEQATKDAHIVLDEKGFHSDETGLPSQHLIQKAEHLKGKSLKRQKDTK
jgi:hypothetical protein